MSHLMQPIDIEGVKYCLTENGRRTTLPINTEIVTFPTDLADLTAPTNWVCTLVGNFSEFEISFGASCISEFTLTVSNATFSSNWQVLISIFANEILMPAYEDILFDPLIDGGVIVVSVDDIPCGTVFSIIVNQQDFNAEDLVTTIGFAV